MFTYIKTQQDLFASAITNRNAQQAVDAFTEATVVASMGGFFGAVKYELADMFQSCSQLCYELGEEDLMFV